MDIKTISASSAQSYEMCSSRYYEENIKRTPQIGGSSEPARKGTCIHDALEEYVRTVYKDKTHEESWEYLLKLLKINFMKQFSLPPSAQDDRWEDILNMAKNWFDRTDLSDVEIVMIEEKNFMMVGPVKFNYIFDRLDTFELNGKRIVRVVDYKTWRKFYSSDALRAKLQSRFYGMAAYFCMKEYKADEVWVCFDQLRYDTVEIKYTREDNVATWKYMVDLIGRMQSERPPGRETPNDECGYCVKRFTCKALTKNADAGGMAALMDDRDKALERLLEMQGAAKTLKYAVEELQNLLLEDAMETDEPAYETEKFSVEFKSVVRTVYDMATIREIIGDELFNAMPKFTNYEIKKLLESSQISAAQKSRINQSAKKTPGEAKPKIIRKYVKDISDRDD